MLPPPHTLAEYWRRAATDLGLVVEAPYELVLPSGGKVHADVLLRAFGAAEGMLLVSESASVWPFRDEIVRLGYGFSVIESSEIYRLDEVRAVLEDWGWSGRESDRPVWLRGG